MESGVIERLEALRPEVKAKWETLLRVEPVSSPLAAPDTLVHLIDWTLDALFDSLRPPHGRRRAGRAGFSVADCAALCPCGRNPLLAYFVAGEQAVLETLVLVQARHGHQDSAQSLVVLELKHALAGLARKEIEAFCAVCQYRQQRRDRHPHLHGTGAPAVALRR
jgi:hypothetical protein